MKKGEDKKTGNVISKSGIILKHQLGLISSPKIVPFIGFGNKNSTYIAGEVIEENGISKPKEGQAKWQNIKAMLRRYFGNELENLRVRVVYRGMNQEAVTDKFGIYRCHFKHSESDLNGTWNKATVSLADHRYNLTESVEGEVMQIIHNPPFGIISDIDDTILVSYATQKFMKIRLMLLNNAHTRMPFEGVSAFYHALQKGTNNNSYNPIFYVSNSEWNLYDLLYEFIQYHRIPKGPLLLREMAIKLLRPWKIKEVNKNHKMEVIRMLFTLFEDMKFILIGDSGQKDPEIYSQIVREFPGRVLAVYIRDAGIPENLTRIEVISQQVLQEFRTEMIVVKDTEAAALHAIEKGFISKENLSLIQQEKDRDVRKKEKPAERLV